MATFASIFVPAQGSGNRESTTKVTGLGGSASSAEISLGQNQLFAIWSTQQINVRFGLAGLAAADATDFGLPAGLIATFDTGDSYRSIRVFNNGAGAADVYVLLLSRV